MFTEHQTVNHNNNLNVYECLQNTKHVNHNNNQTVNDNNNQNVYECLQNTKL